MAEVSVSTLSDLVRRSICWDVTRKGRVSLPVMRGLHDLALADHFAAVDLLLQSETTPPYKKWPDDDVALGAVTSLAWYYMDELGPPVTGHEVYGELLADVVLFTDLVETDEVSPEVLDQLVADGHAVKVTEPGGATYYRRYAEGTE